jgi:hypothetical protein
MHDVVQSNVTFAGPQLQQGEVTRAILSAMRVGLATASANKNSRFCADMKIYVGEVLPTSSD